MDNLKKEHLQGLYNSGFVDKTIEKAGYRSGDKGWEVDLICPYTGAKKYSITRLDKVGEGQGKYQQPNSTKPFPYFSKQIDIWKEVLEDRNQPLILIEGTKKADCAIQNGFLAVSFQGTYGWSHKGKPIKEMAWIFKPGRDIYICFDSDQLENEHVAESIENLAKAAYRTGCNVRLIQLPRETKGIDDFFVKYGEEAKAMFQKLIDEALDPLEGVFLSHEEIRARIHSNKNQPEMNFEMLPDELIKFHNWSKNSTHASDEIIVAMMIGVLATALGKQVAIKSPGGRETFTNIWLCGVAPSGRGKTTAANISLDFLQEINNEQLHIYMEEMNKYDQQMKAFQDSRGDEDLQEEPERPRIRRPILPMFTSKERLYETLAYSDGSGAICAPEELSAALADINNPRNDGQKMFIISCQGGNRGAVTMDYKSGGILPPIEKPAIGILGVSTLGSFFDKIELSDFSSGFLQRFNFIIGKGDKPKQAFPPRRDTELEFHFRTLVQSFFDFDKNYAHVDETKVLELSPQAKSHWISIFSELDKEFGFIHDDAVISSFERYNNETTFKIATVFHCLKEPRQLFISKETLIQAIELVRFFKQSLLYVIEELGKKTKRGMATKIVSKLIRHQTSGLSHKKLKDACNGFKVQGFDDALDWLLDLGIVEIKEIDNGSNNDTKSKIVYLMLERQEGGY